MSGAGKADRRDGLHRRRSVLVQTTGTGEHREHLVHPLVGLRSNLKCQVHGVLAGAGITVPMSDLFGMGGQQLLARAPLAIGSRSRVESILRLLTALHVEIDTFARLVAGRLRTDPGYVAIQEIPGVGPTPTHHESDTTVHRGRITEQGSRRGRTIGVVAAAQELTELVLCGLRDGHIRCLFRTTTTA